MSTERCIFGRCHIFAVFILCTFHKTGKVTGYLLIFPFPVCYTVVIGRPMSQADSGRRERKYPINKYERQMN